MGRNVKAPDVFGPDQELGLGKGAVRLEMENSVDGAAPREKAAEAPLARADGVGVCAAADTQDLNAVPLHVKGGQSFDESDHDRIVGPETAV